MTLGQPGQGEIFPGQVGEYGPALARSPAAGPRQIQPTGFDRVRERRGDRLRDRRARRAIGSVILGVRAQVGCMVNSS